MKDFTKFHADKEIAKYLISEFDNSNEEEIFSATKKIITEFYKTVCIIIQIFKNR